MNFLTESRLGVLVDDEQDPMNCAVAEHDSICLNSSDLTSESFEPSSMQDVLSACFMSRLNL
jgi:hypothetical protein